MNQGASSRWEGAPYVIGLSARLSFSDNFLSASNPVASTNDKYVDRSQRNKNFLLSGDDRFDG